MWPLTYDDHLHVWCSGGTAGRTEIAAACEGITPRVEPGGRQPAVRTGAVSLSTQGHSYLQLATNLREDFKITEKALGCGLV